MSDDPILIDETPTGPFRTRIEALQVRVNKAALALHERNVRPTVQRIRTALGGGSPNDLAPALKRWREEVLPTLKTVDDTPVGVPPLIADIVRELWTRALAAAAVDAIGGAKARRATAQTEEVSALRGELDRLRDQLEREQRLVGELRAARSRAEAIMKDALERLDAAEKRERRAQLRIGELRTRTPMIAEKAKAKPSGRMGGPRPGKKKTPARSVVRRRQVAHSAKATPKTGKQATHHVGRGSRARRKPKAGSSGR